MNEQVCVNCNKTFFARNIREWCSNHCSKELHNKDTIEEDYHIVPDRTYEQIYAKSYRTTVAEARKKISEAKRRYNSYSL